MAKRSDTDSPSTLCSMSTRRSLFGRTVRYMMTENCRSEAALPIDDQCGFTSSELSQSHERHVPRGSILHAFAFDFPPPYYCDSALWNASHSIPRSMQDRWVYNQPQFWKTTLCICTKDDYRGFLLGPLAGQSIAPVPMSVGSGKHHLSSRITLADTLALGVVTNIVEIIVDGIIPDAKDVVSLVEPGRRLRRQTSRVRLITKSSPRSCSCTDHGNGNSDSGVSNHRTTGGLCIGDQMNVSVIWWFLCCLYSRISLTILPRYSLKLLGWFFRPACPPISLGNGHRLWSLRCARPRLQ
ncbi:uncharacterized protein ARMOST_06640 [Armillaria ostoyae]|uniref:Uncharacterized protein n=1 Tax=Armillaria ostoyae TaxID=47428 RepID=A0A284R3J9_ARMOS|nr:uncharacterized protein ARMOST_06640 [Armillaria ostoyae]